VSRFSTKIGETGPFGGYVAIGSPDRPNVIDGDTGTNFTWVVNQSGSFSETITVESPPSADGLRARFDRLDNVDSLTVSAVVDGTEETVISGVTDADEGTWIEGTCDPGLVKEIVVEATVSSGGYVYIAEIQPHELLMPRHGH
jgi:hypothetical protein